MRALLPALLALSIAALPHAVVGEHDYSRNALMPPFRQEDGAVALRSWMWAGSTKLEKDHIGLVPALPDRRGALWNRVAVPSPGWELELDFRVTGADAPQSGEGLALWLTRDQPDPHDMLGPLFGSRLSFRGIGIFFDSFDDDEDGNSPSISVMVSDGHQLYDKSTDGWSSQLAGCVANFRNTQEPVAVRVELVPPAEGLRDPTLVVLVRTDDTPAAEGGGLAFEPCFAVPQISPLPPGDYFVGLSAWNDKAGDAVDILSLQTYAYSSTRHSLSPPVMAAQRDADTGSEEEEEDSVARVHSAEEVLSDQAKAMRRAAEEGRKRKEREGRRYIVHSEAKARRPGEAPTEEEAAAEQRYNRLATASAASARAGSANRSVLDTLIMQQGTLFGELSHLADVQASMHRSLNSSFSAVHSALTSLDGAVRAHSSVLKEAKEEALYRPAQGGGGGGGGGDSATAASRAVASALGDAIAELDSQLRLVRSTVDSIHDGQRGERQALAPQLAGSALEDITQRVRATQVDVRSLLQAAGSSSGGSSSGSAADQRALQEALNLARETKDYVTQLRTEVAQTVREAMHAPREELHHAAARVERFAEEQGGSGFLGTAVAVLAVMSIAQAVMLVVLLRKSAKPDPYKLF